MNKLHEGTRAQLRLLNTYWTSAVCVQLNWFISVSILEYTQTRENRLQKRQSSVLGHMLRCPCCSLFRSLWARTPISTLSAHERISRSAKSLPHVLDSNSVRVLIYFCKYPTIHQKHGKYTAEHRKVVFLIHILWYPCCWAFSGQLRAKWCLSARTESWKDQSGMWSLLLSGSAVNAQCCLQTRSTPHAGAGEMCPVVTLIHPCGLFFSLAEVGGPVLLAQKKRVSCWHWSGGPDEEMLAPGLSWPSPSHDPRLLLLDIISVWSRPSTACAK